MPYTGNPGFSFVQNKARQAALDALKAYTSQTSNNGCDCGGVAKKLPDGASVQLADGTTKKAIWSGVVTGNYVPVTNLDAITVLAMGQAPKQITVDANQRKGLIASRDANGPFISFIGDDKAYYIPISDALRGEDFTLFQVKLSSDGKAVLLGTVVERTDPLDHHQIAKYTIYRNMKFVAYTSEATALLAVDRENYAVDINTGKFIVFCAAGDIIENTVDLNEMADGKILMPELGKKGSSNLWYPFATIHSAFNQFNILIRVKWDAETGPQAQAPQFGPGSSVSTIFQYETHGDENYDWVASPSSSLFSTYSYTFNNDLNGNYNADIVTTFVNAYVVASPKVQWTESFSQALSQEYSGTPSGTVEQDFAWSEELEHDWEYTYSPNFAFNLQYLPTPDVWITENPEVLSTSLGKTWLKHGSNLQAQTLTGGGFTPSSFSGNVTWDAIALEFTEIAGDHFFENESSRIAYSESFTLGPPYELFYDVEDVYQLFFYSGIKTVTKDFFNSQQLFPGFYLDDEPGNGSAQFTYCDLNYDNYFGIDSPQPWVVFSGRSTMVITDLATIPTLYGIIAKTLGDGQDHDELFGAFRGRGFADVSNLSYVYKQNNTHEYFYSSPALALGNLTGIPAEILNDSGGSLDGNSSNNFSQAIADLIDYQSLADVYGNNTLVAQIQAAITGYSNRQIPTDDSLDAIINGIKGLSDDLINGANNLRTELNGINAAINDPNGGVTLFGPDAVGTDPPDIFTDKIFSRHLQWPIPQPGGGFLKAVDSLIAQGYYVDGASEVIQSYNIRDDGFISRGNFVRSALKRTNNLILDYVLPVSKSSTKG